MPSFDAISTAPIAALGLDEGIARVTLTDTLAMAAAQAAVETALLRARAALAPSLAASWEGQVTLRDTLALEALQTLVYRELLADSLALGVSGAVSVTAYVQMRDRLLLAGTVATSYEAHVLIVESLTLAAVLHDKEIVTLDSAAALQAALGTTYLAVARLVDALAMSASLSGSLTLAVLLRDSVAAGVAGSHSFEASVLLRDAVEFVAELAVDDERYIAWTMNTTTKAATRYSNYPFNSFMRVGGEYFGIAASGRYRLGGTDDNGAAINAKLRLGMSAMGARVLKRIPEIYYAVTADGDLIFKVITASAADGAREAYGYRAYVRAADSVREGRVKVGRGLKAVFFDLQLENVDGAAFELDALQFHPLFLERRIRGNAGGKPE